MLHGILRYLPSHLSSRENQAQFYTLPQQMPQMNKYAFTCASGGSSFLNCFRKSLESSTTGLKRSKYLYCKRQRSSIAITAQEKLEPVEDGITLPKPSSRKGLEEESGWLAQQLTSWLDREWQQSTPQPIHEAIANRTAQIYARHRMEGENDLANVLVAIGSELEGMDFSSSFVGPWNIANKTSELLLEHSVGRKLNDESMEKDRGELKWSMEMEEGRGKGRDGNFANAVSLADRFEKMKFLRDLLDEEVSKEEVNGAIAAAVGFRYDVEKQEWYGSEVSDEHFQKFGDKPPDVLGDEKKAEDTDTLRYLEEMLATDDEDGKIAEGLDMVIETIHGVEIYKIQREDENDHSFRKRAVVAKWLHMYGGF